MKVTRWDPWREIAELHAATDQLWEAFLEKLNFSGELQEKIDFLPDADVIESPTEFRVYLSVPGLAEEDLELILDEQTLTVRGERQPPYDPDLDRCQCEWRYGYFERRLTLAGPVRPDLARAYFDNGVLTIFLPKATVS